MKRFLAVIGVFLTALALAAGEVREPAVAGQFYPADPVELGRMVDGFLEKAKLPPDPNGEIVAMITPHAGLVYSGPTAAYVYKLLKQHPVDVVVLVGPWHRGLMDGGASVWTGGTWKTPLGEVAVDTELAEKIASESPAFRYSLEAHSQEHSIEVQLPFLQKVLPQAKIVPILISDPTPANVQALAAAVYKHLAGRKAVFIASSDMSHYYSEDVAHSLDAHTLALLKKEDAEGIFKAHQNRSSELCGEAAVLTALQYAKLRGDSTLEVLDYSTSADTAGDKSRVVGYGASVIWAGRHAVADTNRSLNETQQKKLLELARKTVEAETQGAPLPSVDTADADMKMTRAVFVTIKKNGQLRGCIGRILAEEPLIDAVQHMAVEAATKDPRFSPVAADELKDLHYEISVLSPPMRIGSADEIEMGKHGVLVRQGSQGGVFLPKVAEMFQYDKEKFLDELCSQKAHLPVSCWQDPATELDVFTAQEF